MAEAGGADGAVPQPEGSGPGYAELHCASNFSFLRGASHPEELVARAHALGYAALAITDECSLAGVVRAHVEARRLGLKLLVGAEFRIDAPQPARLVALACTRGGYGELSRFVSRLRLAAPKGRRYRLGWDELRDGRVEAALPGCVLLWVPARDAPFETLRAQAQWAARQWPGRCWLAAELLLALDDARWLEVLARLSALTGLPQVAAGDVLMHLRSRKPLQDVLTAIRLGRPLAECGFALAPNAEQHLRSRPRLARIYPPALLAATLEVAARCEFSLAELRYEYPEEVVPPGETAAGWLRRLTEEGAQRRFPAGVPPQVRAQLEHELALIAELAYERYFLTVHGVVAFARGRGILCQGRGSAANSAVCFCLGITEVDPARMSVLFERFVSRERDEPPDIDVDFEHERREEVIQHLYAKYGRDRAALAATVISYRPRSAIRDVGRAIGLDAARIEALARSHQWWDGRDALAQRLAEAGLDPQEHRARLLLELVPALLGFPRHLSQHVGGFVLTQQPLPLTVPVVPAAMAGRTTIEWDKDDIEALGLMKVDVLALGMLSAIRRALDLLGTRHGRTVRMQDIPAEDAATYEMCCRADTTGVFQIESRAQQSMLPRLQPRRFYDLVVEVAIVRPGPIQGGMVHPYLRCREAQRRDPAWRPPLPDAALAPALARTLGVPIFQEQVMQVAMIAAGFSAGEADALRRAMAAWRRKGGLHRFHERIVEGMLARGYERGFAEAIFRQIEGFGEYGFPESHAASFALLVYVSAWIRRHEPAAFLAALINSQPMGFYSPSQLVQDARRHGIEVRPADVSCSGWDCTLEDERPWRGGSGAPAAPWALPPLADRQPAVRLGLRLVQGLGEAAARRIEAARGAGAFSGVDDLARRAGLDAGELKALAAADALASLAGHRRRQLWDASARHAAPALLHEALLREAPVDEAPLDLPAAPEGEEIVFDYAALGLTLRRHPLALLRPLLAQRRLSSAAELAGAPDGRLVRACGIVTMRQQPGTANGTVFVSLEDETGCVNVIVWKSLRERQRRALLQARLLAVHGRWQRQGAVCHLIAGHLEDLTPLLGRLATASRDFH
ncbi:error-prone DNA polymerase [Caldimonas tepidiphila]|uniref:error-prone DNA polymerase n=1 Tax=Caldimonas tepidiphila TaxID=2315841 RepID=UPI000E5AD744|nr:error-prone DNA polymerase [Caldimonas tepidiphila]